MSDLDIAIIETSGLGDRTYLVSGGVAVVVDPQRDIDRVLAAAHARGVQITHVLETHIHNDDVSGGLELAGVTGAEYGVPAGEDVAFEHRPLADGDDLPADAEIYPTHGFGSFCSATPADGDSSTIGRERQSNPALTQDEQTYVDELLAALSEYPAYYAHMGVVNEKGPAPVDLSPPQPVDPTELRRRIEAGEWVVDLGNRTVFAAGHLSGAVGFELSDSFVTYLGWLYEWGAPLTLLGESDTEIATAQRELVRIGVDDADNAEHLTTT